MPIGSAACLQGSLPQAPLSPFPNHRRARPFALVPTGSGATAPPRLLPLQKVADDPPRGRILVVESDTAAGLELQALLHGSGYRVVGPARSTEEAQLLMERGRARPLSCAMLDVEATDVTALADRLGVLNVPYIWLASTGDAVPPAYSHAPLLRKPFAPSALLDALEEAMRQGASRRWYATPPPQAVWPRVFPQL
jgi:CheY-like chemotaxis protein